jgi:hypothetical protein
MIPKVNLDSMVLILETAVRSIVSNLNSGAVKVIVFNLLVESMERLPLSKELIAL